MEIQALRVLVSQEDINGLLGRVLEDQRLDVRDLRVRLTAEGVTIAGIYETRIMDVPFESLWELSAARGQAVARLAGFTLLGGAAGKAFGVADFLAKGSLRGILMQALADAVRHEPGLRVEGDALYCDVDELLARQGLAVRTNLTSIRCAAGQLTIEAGSG